uniref:Odorant-binding protein 18 n=1 Tax=Pyrrhalta aenescens TaxID=281545 RepID=A0A1J0KKP3_9CUCU|nr:odorant-binding protein 18 [Pyrrhalta aenescens]
MNQNQFLIALVVLASFIFGGNCAPPDNANVTVKDYCIKETGVSGEKVKKMEDESLEELDEDCYCYLHCIFITLKLIDDKGNLDVTKTLKEFPDFDEECLKKVPKIMECTDIAALDDCES